jgi:hypothetical protein
MVILTDMGKAKAKALRIEEITAIYLRAYRMLEAVITARTREQYSLMNL